MTGCAGFIASHVVDQLLAAGHDVVGVDDLNDAYDPRLKEWRLANLARRPRFSFVRADIVDRSALDAIFRGPRFDAIFNLAARAGVRQSLLDPWPYVATNITGTLNLIEQARRHDVRRFVLASTSSLYGLNERPFLETSNTDAPLSPYAATKKGAEALVAAHARAYGIASSVVRYFTVYGPAGRPDMSIFRLIRWIAEGDPVVLYGDGSQERDFTYVTDIARGTILAGEHAHGHEVFNLGNDAPARLIDVLHAIEAQLDRKANLAWRPPHPADVPATWANIEKARRVLGWSPRVPLEQGLQETVDWYLKNREWARQLDLGAV